jgi:endonuclease YncB( thermonuclease family)
MQGRGRAGAIGSAALALALVGATISQAGADCSNRKQTKRAVVAVIDGATIRLDDGREVRLAGILPPSPPPGMGADAVWAPAEAAHKSLAGLLTGRSVRIAVKGQAKDRYGRTLAHVFLLDGKSETWVEEKLVGDGQARVAPSAVTRDCVAALLAIEERARRAKRGLWSHAAYQVRDAAKTHELTDFVQRFEIVEGRVRGVSERKRRIYLDFGDDWSRDLTAIVSGRDRQRFESAKIALMKLKGVKVRLRGWVERWNGPLIRLTHPEQIEVLEPLPAPDTAGTPAPQAASSPAIPIAIAPGTKTPD